MATPALRALREHYVGAEVVGILRPYVADVLAGTTLLDRVLIHDPKGKSPLHRGFGFGCALRRERFDLAVLFPNLHLARIFSLSFPLSRAHYRKQIFPNLNLMVLPLRMRRA